MKFQNICVNLDFENLLQARTLFKKGGQEVPIELLNNIGVLQFERGEFEVCVILLKCSINHVLLWSFPSTLIQSLFISSIVLAC